MKSTMRIFSVLIAAFLLLASTPQVKSQEAYEEGDILLNAGISFGTYGYGFVGNSSFTVPITISGEYGIHEYFSVGAMLGYAKWSYDWGYLGDNYEYSWTYISFGARGSFHYLPLANEHLDFDIDTEKFDFYLSVFLGLENRNYKTNYDYLNNYYSNDTRARLGTFAGFKYMFSDNFGMFLEGGAHAFGYLTLGASLKF